MATATAPEQAVTERTVLKAGPGGGLVPVRVRIMNRLRALRQERGMTLADVAEGAGVTPMTIWRIETGARTGNEAVQRRIAAHFALPVEHLFVIEELSPRERTPEERDGPRGV